MKSLQTLNASPMEFSLAPESSGVDWFTSTLQTARLPRHVVVQALSQVNETCTPRKISYFVSLRELLVCARGSWPCADGAVYVWADLASQRFVILKHVGAPAADGMLVLTELGLRGVMNVETMALEENSVFLAGGFGRASTEASSLASAWAAEAFGAGEGSFLQGIESQIARLYTILAEHAAEHASEPHVKPVKPAQRGPQAIMQDEVLRSVFCLLGAVLTGNQATDTSPAERRSRLLAMAQLLAPDATDGQAASGLLGAPSIGRLADRAQAWAACIKEIQVLRTTSQLQESVHA